MLMNQEEYTEHKEKDGWSDDEEEEEEESLEFGKHTFLSCLQIHNRH